MPTDPASPAPQPSGSPTPRTDANRLPINSHTLPNDIVYADFARELERELTTARAALLASQAQGEKQREALEKAHAQLVKCRHFLPRHGSFGEDGIDAYEFATSLAVEALAAHPASCAAELAELMECKADLDWLESRDGVIVWRGLMSATNAPVFDLHDPRDEGLDAACGEELGTGPTLRAAIRAARKATP